MKNIVFLVVVIISSTGCHFKKYLSLGYWTNTFTPGEYVYQSTVMETEDPETNFITHNLREKKIVDCCRKYKPKDAFDGYLKSKKELTKTKKIPSELMQYSENYSSIFVPHVDAPVGVTDGGIFLSNDNLDCTIFVRKMVKSGYHLVKDDENCSY